MKLTIHQLEIPFKQAFAHARARRSGTEAVLVRVEAPDGNVGLGEGCPRNYVTGETIQSVKTFFEEHRKIWESFQNVRDLEKWAQVNSQSIDQNPAGWCAVELAFFDCWGKNRGVSLETLLNVNELAGPFHYSAVLGTGNAVLFQKQAQQFFTWGFSDFKLKVVGNIETDQKNIALLTDLPIKKLRIRLDANNLWKTADEAVAYLQRLNFPFLAIEEPLQTGDYDGCRQISQQLGCPIILDESFLRIAQFQHLQNDPELWIINIRISKMGGILRSLAIADKAKDKGIPIIIGAQVGETSILTRAALMVANEYRHILLAQEGAFGTYLLEHDITTPALMFGKGGQLDSQALSGQPGFGLSFELSD